MSRSDYIHRKTDNNVALEGFANQDTDAYLNTATVAFTLYESVAGSDDNGAAVTGATAITMSYVTASNGDYVGVIQSTVDLARLACFWVEVSASQSGIVLFKRWQVQAVDEGKEAG